MRTQLLPVLIAVAAVSGCTTEDYYRSANKSAELNTTANLEKVDTIKTSAVSQQRTFVFPIAATDENGNINLLTTFADGGETRIIGRSDDGDDEAIENIELTKERYNFTRQVEFIPNVDGRHTVNVRVRDDFGNITSMEKYVYSFTNMRPKLKVTYYAERANVIGAYHYIDFSASYDRDNTWGGDIDSLFILAKAMDYINSTGDIDGGTIHESTKVGSPPDGVHIDKYIMYGNWYDDGVDWFTDIWVWVKDNENMPSDTVHIPIGHVESSVPRKEYEGR